jgi:microcystin-dependent protein
MAGYTRQDSDNNISNGSVINADDFDAEYNAVEAAFNSSTGHKHDGTAGEGAPIEEVGPAQDLVVSSSQVLPKTTNTLDLGSASVQFKSAWFDGTVDTDYLIVSDNTAMGGTLSVTGTITGNLTGNVTGNLTGNVTGNVTGDVTGDVTGQVSDVSNHDTDDITEGSTNLYHTTARARAAISGSGSLSYNSTTGEMSFTQGNTDTVAEGSTNLYYTNARAKAAISVTDSGGDGSLAYNNTTGVVTYTGPSATEVRAHLSAGTGVSYSNGQFSIGQPVGISADVTFGNAIVQNLTVNGTTTTVNSNDVNIADSTLTLNSDETGAPSQNAGIVIERGTSSNVSFLWQEDWDRWSTDGQALSTGTLVATGLTLGGTAVSATASELNTLDGLTASTAELNKLDGVTASTAALNTASTHYVPSGGIIMWSGSIAAIPTGWVLCNGSNSTPDLRNRFVVGAGSSYNPGNTGGASTVALSTANLPAHNHSASSSSTVSDPGHSHSYINSGANYSNNYSPYSGPSVNNETRTTSPATTGISVSTSTTIGNTGSGTAHENRPPYYALAYIMKT